ncbi:MAG: SBBP repeat-containing protein [Opitutales bacterium]|nr:SBBP repeat-containing protein [Opitutales bacterium]
MRKTAALLIALSLIHQILVSNDSSAPLFSNLLGPVRANMPWKHGRVTNAPNGDICITGPIALKGFTMAPEGWDTHINQHKCLIIRLSADGKIIANTLFGSSKQTYPYAITTDNEGFVYVAGGTNATDLPTTQGAYDNTYNGGKWGDGWIAKFSPDLTKLIFATYFGSEDSEEIWDLSIDPEGNICVMGGTLGSNFPVTEGSYDTTHNGGEFGDGVVAKFTSDGKRLLFSTFVGGNGTDMPAGLAVDQEGNVLIGGLTESKDYPIVNSPSDKALSGEKDLGISLVSSDGSKLIFSQLFGGFKNENASRFVYLKDGSIVFACNTSSPDYPVVEGTERKQLRGTQDILIAQLSKNGELRFSSIFGGSDYEELSHVFLDDSGRIVIVGLTKSKDFPTTKNAADRHLGGEIDCFALVFDLKNQKIDYATYLGGNSSESGMQGAVAGRNRILVSGITQSTDFPVTDDSHFKNFENTKWGKGGGNLFITLIDTAQPNP